MISYILRSCPRKSWHLEFWLITEFLEIFTVRWLVYSIGKNPIYLTCSAFSPKFCNDMQGRSRIKKIVYLRVSFKLFTWGSKTWRIWLNDTKWTYCIILHFFYWLISKIWHNNWELCCFQKYNTDSPFQIWASVLLVKEALIKSITRSGILTTICV